MVTSKRSWRLLVDQTFCAVVDFLQGAGDGGEQLMQDVCSAQPHNATGMRGLVKDIEG